jgi:hypothetical protein
MYCTTRAGLVLSGDDSGYHPDSYTLPRPNLRTRRAEDEGLSMAHVQRGIRGLTDLDECLSPFEAWTTAAAPRGTRRSRSPGSHSPLQDIVGGTKFQLALRQSVNTSLLILLHHCPQHFYPSRSHRDHLVLCILPRSRSATLIHNRRPCLIRYKVDPLFVRGLCPISTYADSYDQRNYDSRDFLGRCSQIGQTGVTASPKDTGQVSQFHGFRFLVRIIGALLKRAFVGSSFFTGCSSALSVLALV